MKIKVKTFSKYKIYDKKDFYRKVYNYLLDKNMGYCFLQNGKMISREDCKTIIGI